VPRRIPYAKGTFPKLPSVASKRFIPQDAKALFTSPPLPKSWYKVSNAQSNPSPAAYTLSSKEMEERTSLAGRDLSVISELDWLASGSNTLLGMLVRAPELNHILPYLTLLQRYSLEMCRDLEILGLSTTARYANNIWHMRDGYVTRLHPAVPKQTREALRGASLNSKQLFPEEAVALAAESLKSDVQLQNMSQSVCVY